MLRKIALSSLFFVPFFFLIPPEGSTVRKDNLILSSAVQGQLLDHGKSVEKAKVMRQLHWNMDAEPRVEITFTDKDGYFQFPEVRGTAEFGYLARLFHVPTMSIEIYIPVDGVEYLFYANGRHSYEGHEETGLPEIQMVCDLKSRSASAALLPVGECEVELSDEIKNRKYD